MAIRGRGDWIKMYHWDEIHHEERGHSQREGAGEKPDNGNHFGHVLAWHVPRLDHIIDRE